MYSGAISWCYVMYKGEIVKASVMLSRDPLSITNRRLKVGDIYSWTGCGPLDARTKMPINQVNRG